MFFGVINRKILARKPNESEIDTFTLSCSVRPGKSSTHRLSVFQLFIIFNLWESAYGYRD
ncbi:hypothetical protein Pgin02_01831 [Porphyromonas gingivalis]